MKLLPFLLMPDRLFFFFSFPCNDRQAPVARKDEEATCGASRIIIDIF